MLCMLLGTAACADVANEVDASASAPPAPQTRTQALDEAPLATAAQPAEAFPSDPPPDEAPAPTARQEDVRPGDSPQEPPAPPVLPTETPRASDEARERQPAPRRTPVEVDEAFARSQEAFERQELELANDPRADAADPTDPVSEDARRELAKLEFMKAEGWLAPVTQP